MRPFLRLSNVFASVCRAASDKLGLFRLGLVVKHGLSRFAIYIGTKPPHNRGLFLTQRA